MAYRTNWLIALAVLAAGCYAVLWIGHAMQWAWLAAMDSAALEPLHRYGVKQPGWVRFWEVLCEVLGPAGLRVVGAVAVVVALLRRNLRAILFVLMTVGLSFILTVVAKALADRPRPGRALAEASLSSFPSGHALSVMAAVLGLLTISAGMFPRWARILTIVLGATAVIAVGVGRVVLNVHHPSDVLAGWAAGYLWFFFWLLVIRPVPLAAPAAPDAEPIGEAAEKTLEAPGTER